MDRTCIKYFALWDRICWNCLLHFEFWDWCCISCKSGISIIHHIWKIMSRHNLSYVLIQNSFHAYYYELQLKEKKPKIVNNNTNVNYLNPSHEDTLIHLGFS